MELDRIQSGSGLFNPDCLESPLVNAAAAVDYL